MGHMADDQRVFHPLYEWLSTFILWTLGAAGEGDGSGWAGLIRTSCLLPFDTLNTGTAFYLKNRFLCLGAGIKPLF